MSIRFDGRVAVVTGAGGGLGRAYALELARRGAKVVVNDLGGSRDGIGHSDTAAKVVEEIEALGGEALANGGSVTDYAQMEAMVAAAKEKWGGVHILINNAGFMTFADMLGVDEKTWDEIYSVSVRAPMRIMKAVLKEMVKAGRGSVINIGSSWSSRAAGFNMDGGGVDYCSSKAALQALTRAAAQDVAPKGVRVNNIAPGAVDTPMHADHRDLLYQFVKYIPLGRMGMAEDLAGTAVFLASDASTFITGQTIHVNGGMLMVD